MQRFTLVVLCLAVQLASAAYAHEYQELARIFHD